MRTYKGRISGLYETSILNVYIQDWLIKRLQKINCRSSIVIQHLPSHLSQIHLRHLCLMQNKTSAINIELIDFINQYPDINIISVMSHLAAADIPSEDEFTYLQITRFQKIYQRCLCFYC